MLRTMGPAMEEKWTCVQLCDESDQEMYTFLGKGSYYSMNVTRDLDRSDSQRDLKKK